jgi:site-specific recombinase XerC
MNDEEDHADMNAVALKITETPAATSEEMALRIRQEAPTLANLNPEQLEQIARIVMTQRLTAELNTAVNLAGIDYAREQTLFLDNAGQEKSTHTRRGYDNALRKFDAWTAVQGINPLELKPSQADDFIYFLKASGTAPATVRHAVAAVSSFFSFLYRRHPAIDNPFRGSRARPKEKAVRPLAIPTADEVEVMLRDMPPLWAAAVAVMAGRGLRCGALPGLSIKGDRFTSHSKGKDISGNLAPEIIEKVKAAGLPLREPFAGRTVNSIELAVGYYIKKLHKSGAIAGNYSCHDLRHFAAVREYGTDKDIRRVRDFLFHSSITTTERYLRSLGAL